MRSGIVALNAPACTRSSRPVGPALIVEEAGGKISDGHGNPLIHDYSRFDVPYVVASNGKVHADLLDLLAAGASPT